MTEAVLFFICLAGFWLYLGSRTRRPDGVPTENVHPYRKMLLLISPTTTESVFQAELDIPAEELERFLKDHPEHSLTEVLVASLISTFRDIPEMNRFVAGGRLYNRSSVAISFSVKRQRGNAKAKVAVVKLDTSTPLSLAEVSTRIKAKISHERSGKKTYADKEYDLFSKIPHGILKRAPRLLMWMDSHGLLPQSFIANDPLFASAFIANLGSIGMRAGHHHLFEWGNCPVFITVGAIQWQARATESGVESRRILPLRITYDERIDDGLTAKAGLSALQGYLQEPGKLVQSRDQPALNEEIS